MCEYECPICSDPIVPFLGAYDRRPALTCLKCGFRRTDKPVPETGLVIPISRRPGKAADQKSERRALMC